MRRSLVLITVTAAALAVAFPASAHVTVDAPGASAGAGDQIVNVRVPTESETLSTVGLKLQLPVDTPIASVLVQTTPGWTFTETTSKLAKPITTDDGTISEAVTEIDWKATGGGIAPNEFQDFTFLAGQLPDVDQVVFRAIQQYSDGSTVNWIETPAAGSNAEPEHPAPVLTLSAAAGAAAATTSSDDTAPIILSIVALVVAAAALGLAVVGRARRKAGQ